jgi:hypothetical protein
MKLRYISAGVVIILGISFYFGEDVDARGPAGGMAISTPRAAVRAQRVTAAQAALRAAQSDLLGQVGGQAALQRYYESLSIPYQQATSDAARAYQQAVTRSGFLAQGGIQAVGEQLARDAADLVNPNREEATWTWPYGANGLAYAGVGAYPGYAAYAGDIGYAGDSGYAGGYSQTAPGAALDGTSQVVGAAGQYNQASAAAAVNVTQAESNELRNQVQRVQAAWDIQRIGREERERQRGPRPTTEELALRARAAAPAVLEPSQMDLASGTIFWPAALRGNDFEQHRVEINRLAARWAGYRALDGDERAEMREHVGAMFDLLNDQITSIPPQEYMASRRFLESLLYETTQTTI